tara:strand:+ start:643 stop:1002 length:360 start_codon:yes stop_codon:yes gene_type:complete
MIHLYVTYMTDDSGETKPINDEMLMNAQQVNTISYVSKVDAERLDLDDKTDHMMVTMVDGQKIYCCGTIHDVIEQTIKKDYECELDELGSALEGIGHLLGQWLYTYRLHKAEQGPRPVC